MVRPPQSMRTPRTLGEPVGATSELTWLCALGEPAIARCGPGLPVCHPCALRALLATLARPSPRTLARTRVHLRCPANRAHTANAHESMFLCMHVAARACEAARVGLGVLATLLAVCRAPYRMSSDCFARGSECTQSWEGLSHPPSERFCRIPSWVRHLQTTTRGKPL